MGVECANIDACGSRQHFQPMEDPPETRQPAPSGSLCPPGAALFLLYSLATLASYMLEVASHNLVIRAAGPLLSSLLSATWFSHQAAANVTFTVLLPLTLTWTCSSWPLGDTFCHLDPGLAFLTFYASGRLLTHAAAGCCTCALASLGAEPPCSPKAGFLDRRVLAPGAGPGHTSLANPGEPG